MYKKWLSELVIALGCFWSQTNLNGLGFHRMNFIDLHLEEGLKCYDRSTWRPMYYLAFNNPCILCQIMVLVYYTKLSVWNVLQS